MSRQGDLRIIGFVGATRGRPATEEDKALITEEQAISIAKEECARRGWAWNPGMKILTKPKWPWWRVYTPGKGMGMAIEIDKETGEVTHVGRWPR